MSLAKWRTRCGADALSFKLDMLVESAAAPRDHSPVGAADASSPVFLVDHSACILCDRCVRACDDVKENHVIGRTGKEQQPASDSI